jgi:hypothetical protein
MTARQLSERVPNADRAFFGPSADACSQKFEGPRSRPELPRSPAFVRIVSILGRPELPRFPQQFLHSWSPASGSWGWSADRESKQA